MDCRYCGKQFEDEAARYLFLAKFVQSRRERACFDFSCLKCGERLALKEREYRRERFSQDEEPTVTLEEAMMRSFR